MEDLEIENKVDEARKAVSEECLMASAQSHSLYRLMVSTGGGKTYSSLRFALHHAMKFKKQHSYMLLRLVLFLNKMLRILRMQLEERILFWNTTVMLFARIRLMKKGIRC